MTAELDSGRQFVRTLREQDGRTLIESRCKQCGETLVGSAIFDDLLEQERRHVAQCRETGTQGKV
jgi:hypothetical protein